MLTHDITVHLLNMVSGFLIKHSVWPINCINERVDSKHSEAMLTKPVLNFSVFTCDILQCCYDATRRNDAMTSHFRHKCLRTLSDATVVYACFSAKFSKSATCDDDLRCWLQSPPSSSC